MHRGWPKAITGFPKAKQRWRGWLQGNRGWYGRTPQSISQPLNIPLTDQQHDLLLKTLAVAAPAGEDGGCAGDSSPRGETMKKTFAILLLLSLVVGCGSDAQKALDDNTAARNANTEAIQAKNKTNQSSGENENPLLEDERPAGKKGTPKKRFIRCPQWKATPLQDWMGKASGRSSIPMDPPIVDRARNRRRVRHNGVSVETG